MHITKIFETIIESDPQDHWERMDHKGAERAVYKGDVNLRIESDFEQDRLVEDFKEDWANKHPDPSASSRSFNIFYGATLIGYVILVSVDGGRARLPLPDRKTMTPELLAFRVAEIINCSSLHEYMKRAGLNYPTGAL